GVQTEEQSQDGRQREAFHGRGLHRGMTQRPDYSRGNGSIAEESAAARAVPSGLRHRRFLAVDDLDVLAQQVQVRGALRGDGLDLVTALEAAVLDPEVAVGL